jgi:hypothetical protein
MWIFTVYLCCSARFKEMREWRQDWAQKVRVMRETYFKVCLKHSSGFFFFLAVLGIELRASHI